MKVKQALKNRLKSKLRGQAGETIAETLIALLISALALTMLAGAVSTAASLITHSEDVMTGYYDGVSALGNPSEKNQLAVKLDGGNTKLAEDAASISVDYALNEAFDGKAVIAYKKTA